MSTARTLDIYLDPDMLASARAGRHNYMNRIAAAFTSRDFQVRYRKNSPADRLAAATRPGYSLFHMHEPLHPRTLTTRRAYFYPFWRIEATGERWNWDVAKTAFRPDDVDPDAAARFFRFWCKRLFNLTETPSTENGMVFVPLQGHLTERRSFQAASPMEMLRTTLDQDSARRVVATLHPGEAYSPSERDALNSLAHKEPRLRISGRPAEALLHACDYVVTQNSAVALSGFFFNRPAVLFGKIDFHHIAANVHALGAAEAFRKVAEVTPVYDRYLFWFLEPTSINAGKEDAEDKILAKVRRHGWDI